MQLLTAICAARPDRLQECILSAPLGVSCLVAVLDDARDAVRNAGLILLVDLTSGANEELRKIVAFEDVFAKLFTLISNEGGLADAGITAQDCLSLLAHLIKGSPSNQAMFRESGCATQMVRLLSEAFPPDEDEVAFVTQGRERGAWGLLQLLGLFLESGESSTAQNQAAFFRVGAAQVLIDLGFCADLPTPIRILALKGASQLIACNPSIQESFAALTVVSALPEVTPKISGQVNGTKSAPSNRGSARPSAERPRTERPRTYVIEALLDLTLSSPQDETTLRAAACGLMQAYLANHDRIKWHFLQRAIAGHAEREHAANVLNTLLHPDVEAQSVVFGSWIVADLIADQPEAKNALAAVKEGNESEGEDVLTSIQSLGSQLQDALQPADERLVAAYASLLTVLLWEFADGVNNLLAEGSGLIQALVASANPNHGEVVIAGLAASLLGTVYEFSTKDSPIPRRTLAPLLSQKLGRSKYLDALDQFRRHPAVRDADLEAGGNESLLTATFVDRFMNEYSRLRKAVDKDPGVEVLPPSAAEAGVDRDVLDDLRQQLQTTKDALTQAQQASLSASQQVEQDRLTTQKELQTATTEVERVRRINVAMQTGHESELQKIAREHQERHQQLAVEHGRALGAAKAEADRQTEVRLREQGAASAQKTADLEKRLAELGNDKRNEQNKHADTSRKLEQLTGRHTALTTQEQDVRRQFDDITQRHTKLDREHTQLREDAERAKSELSNVKSESEKRAELVTRMTGQIKELREELKGREEELSTERAGYGELEKEVESANEKAEASAKKAAELADKLTDAEKKATDAEEKARAAEKKAKEAEGKVEAAEKKASEASNAASKKDGGKGASKADNKKLSDLESKLSALQKEADGVKAELEAARTEAEQARVGVKTAQEGEKSAKEELESMLLVMGDIEAKRDEYRGKLKALGGEVSEEDSDEEEEEEGEDDEA